MTVTGRPHPKERPRAVNGGPMYTPTKTRKAEELISKSWDGPKFEGPVKVTICVTEEYAMIDVEPVEGIVMKDIKLRGDIDNYAKTLLDGLNGQAWVDDAQVIKLEVVKL